MAKDNKAKAGKATAEIIDFTNVKDGGGQFQKKHYPAADYPAEILGVVATTKKDDKAVKMWLWTIGVKTGKYPYYTVRTDPNQAWKIRNLFVAAGVNVPKKRAKVDPNVIVGKKIAVTLDDEEYDGKMQSVISSTFPLSELDEADAKDEEPKSKKGKPVEAPQGGKKGKKNKKSKHSVSDGELEALEVEDI